MKKLLTLFIMIVSFSFMNCTKAHEPIPVTRDVDLCSEAEVNLKKIDCIPKTEPFTKKGKTFTVFCKEKMKDGVDLNPKCLSKINKCDEMDVCTNSK